jgi:hypothetical protein
VRPFDAVADPAPQFYQALADARPGDSLVALRPPDPARLPELADSVRRTVRAQDWVLVQSSRLVVLLVGGHSGAGESLRRRLPPVASEAEVYAATVGDDAEPSETFTQLTSRFG